jgi:ribose transport system substrate-binding protein
VKKVFIGFLLVVFIVAVGFLGAGCKSTETVATAETTAAAVTTAAETTAQNATETVAATTEGSDFDDFLAAAKEKKEYPGKPGEGLKIGFANLIKGISFTELVEKGIIENAKLAGFADSDVFIADNQFDPAISVKNADIMISKGVNAFIEFQLDAKVNAIIGAKCKDADIPILGVDIPVPGGIFTGVDNWGTSYDNGKFLAKALVEKYGSIDNVDLIILASQPVCGEVVMLRTFGAQQALEEEFGADVLKDKLIIVDCGASAEEAEAGLIPVLADHPNAKKMVIHTVDGMQGVGVRSALDTYNITPESTYIMSNGLDETDQEYLRKGYINACRAYFPENYGNVIVPAAVAAAKHIYVPPEVYVETIIVTLDTLYDYYPNSGK